MGDPAADPTTPNHGRKDKYLALAQGESIQAEYIWIGAKNDLRSKAKTLLKQGFCHAPSH